MARRDSSPDFIEALARGLDVIRAFQPRQPVMSLSAVARAAGLARPTARRILLTLEQMGYVRAVEPLEQMGDVRAADRKAVDRKAVDRKYELTPRVLELGMSYVLSRNLWDVARPHMKRLVARTHESSSIAQLDGSDIVYVARVAVPKIVALAVTIGTRFPAMQTSLGKVLLAAIKSAVGSINATGLPRPRGGHGQYARPVNRAKLLLDTRRQAGQCSGQAAYARCADTCP